MELQNKKSSFILKINFETIIDFDRKKSNNNKNRQNRFWPPKINSASKHGLISFWFV